MPSRPGQVVLNLHEAGQGVAELAGRGARVIVLPELFSTGYTLSSSLRDIVADSQTDVQNALIGWAREHQVVIATAVATVLANGSLEDTSVIVGPDGVLATSAKRHLWGDEPSVFRRGESPPAVVSTPFGVVGVAICYEGGFPEVARQIALAGADIIAIPAAFGRGRLYAWQILTRSRALENGCFVAAAGLTGEDDDRAYAGHSCIVSPSGQILTSLADAPGVVATPIDLADVHRARRSIPYLADLRRSGAIAMSPQNPSGVPDSSVQFGAHTPLGHSPPAASYPSPNSSQRSRSTL